jgi:hypothetical protein
MHGGSPLRQADSGGGWRGGSPRESVLDALRRTIYKARLFSGAGAPQNAKGSGVRERWPRG